MYIDRPTTTERVVFSPGHRRLLMITLLMITLLVITLLVITLLMSTLLMITLLRITLLPSLCPPDCVVDQFQSSPPGIQTSRKMPLKMIVRNDKAT